MALAERGEGLPRTDLQEETIWILRERREPVRESDGLSQVTRPVCRIARFLFRDPGPRHVRDPRDLRLPELRRPEHLGERRRNALHEVGVEGVRNAERARLDAARGERPL